MHLYRREELGIEPTTMWLEDNQLSIDTKKLYSKKDKKKKTTTTQHFFLFFWFYISTASYIRGWLYTID